ncbi:MAG: hypothetical protein JST09_06900 [Bacteroidetes bacterium]|nr:hypothetical protein [Bacteroidota bacterium]
MALKKPGHTSIAVESAKQASHSNSVDLKTTPKAFYKTVSIKYGNSTAQACVREAETRFIPDSKSFTTGTTVFWTPAFTLPITGYAYFVDASTGKIWNVNSSTGVIGTLYGTCP